MQTEFNQLSTLAGRATLQDKARIVPNPDCQCVPGNTHAMSATAKADLRAYSTVATAGQPAAPTGAPKS